MAQIKATIEISKAELDLRQSIKEMTNTVYKRLKRLEMNDLTKTPAYRAYMEQGKPDFAVRGKSYNELVSQYWRMKRFIDDKTSTVRGANKVLKAMAKETGISYQNLAELKAKSSKFFELASKIKQDYKTMGEMAKALDYRPIWESINLFVKEEGVKLDEVEDLDEVLEQYKNFIDRVRKEYSNNPLIDVKI